MKYFVASDIHGYCTAFTNSLNEKGFDINNPDHKVIICGDAFDRGTENVKLWQFMKELASKNKLIYIRGNHEELLEDCLKHQYFDSDDVGNGTAITVTEFANFQNGKKINRLELKRDSKLVFKKAKETGIIEWINDHVVNYFETEHYIFVHGFLPCVTKECWMEYDKNGHTMIAFYPKCKILDDWRNADELGWYNSRWVNGIDIYFKNKAVNNIKLEKTLVVGHIRSSLANAFVKYGIFATERQIYDYCYNDMKKDEHCKPYISDDFIALDSSSNYTKKVNVIVLED